MRLARNPARLPLIVGWAALLAFGCASRSVTPFEPGENRYRFSLVLSREIGETGSCTASVSVRDLAAKRTITIPDFTAPWGANAVAAAADSLYGARLEATVTVSADGAKGECRAVLMRGASLIASRAASVPVVVARGSSR